MLLVSVSVVTTFPLAPWWLARRDGTTIATAVVYHPLDVVSERRSLNIAGRTEAQRTAVNLQPDASLPPAVVWLSDLSQVWPMRWCQRHGRSSGVKGKGPSWSRVWTKEVGRHSGW